MKTLLLNFMLLLFCTHPLLAQEREQNSAFKNYSSSIFDKKETALSLFLPDNKIVSASANASTSPNSVVNIEQIGTYNAANINISSNKATIAVSQNGNYNDYFLTAHGEDITKEIVQNGNNNKIQDYSNGNSYTVNTQMIQNGNNQNIRSFGANSLSQEMKVIQKGNDATVLIINYK